MNIIVPLVNFSLWSLRVQFLCSLCLQNKRMAEKSTQADNKTNSIYMQMHHFRFESTNLQIYIILAILQIEEH